VLKGKKILLGITGSIAAYKAALIVRQLVKQEAEVKIILTKSGSEFITPLTLATLSKKPVLSEFVKDESGLWNNHVELGLWADLMVIAPATANTIAKMANGHCDNLLLATYLSAKCHVMVAPAMDLDMYTHQGTKENISRIIMFKNQVIDPEHGELASGLIGTGRMAEPEVIVQNIEAFFSEKKRLHNKRVLINAGPTYEAIDPVRFIGNHSSGKMGYALAKNIADMGAEVELVSGPTNLSIDHPNIRLTNVTSAQEMFEACSDIFPTVDIGILAAAVADYAPVNIGAHKIKKGNGSMAIELLKTVDIAAELGKIKSKSQFLVGFALETEKEKENASAKLKSKNFDMIVLNSLQDEGAGFGYDTNKISVLHKDLTIKDFELKYKDEVANDIIEEMVAKISD